MFERLGDVLSMFRFAFWRSWNRVYEVKLEKDEFGDSCVFSGSYKQLMAYAVNRLPKKDHWVKVDSTDPPLHFRHLLEAGAVWWSDVAGGRILIGCSQTHRPLSRETARAPAKPL